MEIIGVVGVLTVFVYWDLIEKCQLFKMIDDF